MILCLGFEGLILAFSGFPFHGLPVFIYLEGTVWISTGVSVLYFPKFPQIAAILGWTMFIFTSIESHTDPSVSHSVSGFLWDHSVELIFIAASHLGWLAVLRKRHPAF
jgi:hypothetical protein